MFERALNLIKILMQLKKKMNFEIEHRHDVLKRIISYIQFLHGTLRVNFTLL